MLEFVFCFRKSFRHCALEVNPRSLSRAVLAEEPRLFDDLLEVFALDDFEPDGRDALND